MNIEDILKSRSNGLHYSSMFSLTEPHSNYPGKLPAPRTAILKRLESLDAQTLNTLDALATSLRSEPFFDKLLPDELYMLRQRLNCAIDFLARLADSMPSPGWLSAATDKLSDEDQWLLVGIWKEYGLFWLQNLAWRISRGAQE